MPIIGIVAAGGLGPSTPTIGTATAGDTSASVAFTASSYIGKGTITYTATSSPGGLTGISATSPITVSGLTNGTAYTFTVVGNTNYGVASQASAASNSVSPAPAVVSDYETIASTVLVSATGQVTFDSIPSTYRHLQFRISAGANADTQLDATFNNDGSSSYWAGGIVSTGAGNFPEIVGNRSTMIWEAMSATSNIFTGYVADIIDYKDTSKGKQVRNLTGLQNNGTGARVSIYSNFYSGTSAITRVDLFARSTTFKVGSVFALYGIRGA